MPFFTLIFLVALGVDYSIFLIGRVKEEVPRHGTRVGVHKAVSATGAIITSAGLILAGTFAALLTGQIMGLVQLGSRWRSACWWTLLWCAPCWSQPSPSCWTSSPGGPAI